MRLGFAIAAFLEADVLLLDEVFAVGDENFQRKCFGVISAFKSQRRDDPLRLSRCACRRAALRACRSFCRRREAPSTARRTRRSSATGGCSPTSSTPPSVRAGPREWGTRRGGDRCGPTARRGGRGTCSSSSPGSRSARRRPRARTHRCRRRRLHLELRDDSGLLVAEDAAETEGARLARRPRRVTRRSTSYRLSLEFGRFRLRLGLDRARTAAAALARRRDRLPRLPGQRGAGSVRLGGTWRTGANQDHR